GTGGNGSGLAGCIDPLWMRAVTERVRQFFYYPEAALAVHRTGLVLVHFVVRRNGQLDRLELGKSSCDAELDKAAIDILHVYAPLSIHFGVRSVTGGMRFVNCAV